MQRDTSPELGQPEKPANSDAIESGPQESVVPAADRQDVIRLLGRFIPGTVVLSPPPHASIYTRPYVQRRHGDPR